MGRGGALVKAMTKAIKLHKGEIRTSSKVAKIILEGTNKKKAVGVVLENGNSFYANQIVSNADIGITYNKLVGRENLSQKLQSKLKRTKYSCTSLMFFLTVNIDVAKYGLDSGNNWIMPDKDSDDYYDNAISEDILKDKLFEGLFISCTTLKDPSSFDGIHHSLEIITFIDYSSFKKYEDEKVKRSQGYIDLKRN